VYKEKVKKLIIEKVDQYSIIEQKRNESIIRFFNNSVSLAATGSSTILQIYATVGKKRSITTINNMADLDRQVEIFISKLQSLPDGEVAELPAKANYKFNNDFDELLDQEGMVRSVKDAIQSATEAGAERLAGIFKGNKYEIGIITSSGNEAVDKRTSYALNIRAFKEGSSGSGISVSTRISGIDPQATGKEAGEISKLSRNPRKINEGVYDVLLYPNVSASVLELVGISASAYLVEIGMSFLKGMLGKTVTASNFSLIDHGQVEGGIGSRAFDDEGAPTGETEIIKDGVFNSYLHNSVTAKSWNTNTTGNAGIIEPEPWNLVVEGGRNAKDKLVSEMKSGIIITNNWYTRFNSYIKGEFSTLVRDAAFYVNNGQIEYPVSGLRLSDNLPRLLSNIVAFSETTKWIKWWGEVSTPVKAPYMLVSGSNISIA